MNWIVQPGQPDPTAPARLELVTRIADQALRINDRLLAERAAPVEAPAAAVSQAGSQPAPAAKVPQAPPRA